MHKPTIDQAAVHGLATAALLAHCPDFKNDLLANMPDDDLAEKVLNLDAVYERLEGAEEPSSIIVEAFDAAFFFGLQLGARLGSDPLHVPNIADLVEKYRFRARARALAS